MTGYEVTVSGPDGSRRILLAKEQVEFFKREFGDLYSTALWLAYCHVWEGEK